MAKAIAKANATASAKVYLVYVTGASDGESYLLMDATLETFMGMKCIRGFYTLQSTSWHFTADRVARIPLERVKLIIEYDSLESYKQAVKRHWEERAK